MKKKIDQSKKAKQRFCSPALEHLRTDIKISKRYLANALGVGDRQARNMISEIALYYPILSNAKEKGYRLAKNPRDMSLLEVEDELAELKHTLNEINSRTTYLNRRKKPLIANIKVLEAMIEEERKELAQL